MRIVASKQAPGDCPCEVAEWRSPGCFRDNEKISTAYIELAIASGKSFEPLHRPTVVVPPFSGQVTRRQQLKDRH
jgi:hypothetical protein